MFEGNVNSLGFNKHEQVPVDDAKIMKYLRIIGVDEPTIFSLLWGSEMGSPNSHLFPEPLKEVVQDILLHFMKREAACDTAEVQLHGIIIDLLQVMYEKQVNDIVDITLKK